MNGYIKAKKEVDPVYNEYGEDISDSAAFEDEFIPCKYTSGTRDDLVDIGGGVFVIASYIITTKNMTINARHFALYDSKKTLICEKDCKRIDRLENIRRTKIIL